MNLDKYQEITSLVQKYDAQLVAVSKTKPISAIKDVYDQGQRVFGENRVFELGEKVEQLPQDIEWHMIGHLQRNKVKEVVQHVELIHSADSNRLISQINKDARTIERVVPILIQLKIASEESKYGFDIQELTEWLGENPFGEMKHVSVVGVMGMATFTDDKDQVRNEFKSLRSYFDQLKKEFFADSDSFKEISMGMSGDYEIALDEGSTIIRVGSAIFGARQ